MIKNIYNCDYASACFFRSTVEQPNMKIMLQVTERCNLRCAHCFVEAENSGNEMNIELIKKQIIPSFLENSVKKVTLTGGEPMFHKDIKEIILAFLDNKIGVSVCTNGTLIDKQFIEELTQFNNIHFNVSLDGFSKESHGKFRGNMSQIQFDKLLNNIRLLGRLNLLNGILTTPNRYATIEEYIELCKFAINAKAKYILMNPLSPFGRGNEAENLAYSREELIELKERTKNFITKNFEIVYIRFPNVDGLPISKCAMGSIPYVFCNGDIAICPYMVFASESNTNEYNSKDFILGNIFNRIDIKNSIQQYKLPRQVLTDNQCEMSNCGCYAIKISKNQCLTDFDFDML